jgi:hypothetical protein
MPPPGALLYFFFSLWRKKVIIKDIEAIPFARSFKGFQRAA